MNAGIVLQPLCLLCLEQNFVVFPLRNLPSLRVAVDSTVRMAADGRVFGGFAEKIYSLTCETTVDFHIMYFDVAMQGR